MSEISFSSATQIKKYWQCNYTVAMDMAPCSGTFQAKMCSCTSKHGRLAWNIPRETFTYLLEGFFCKDLVTLRNQILPKYARFVMNLLASPSKEVRFLAKNVMYDQQSNIAWILSYIESISKCKSMNFANWKVRQMLPVKCVPVNKNWRTRLLISLLESRHSMNYLSLNLSMTQSKEMIRSLCTS